MAPPATSSSTSSVAPQVNDLKIRLLGAEQYGDFRDDLARNGFAVVKGAVPRDRADAYGKKFYDYLEGLFVAFPPG
jgi:hypothetical protein